MYYLHYLLCSYFSFCIDDHQSYQGHTVRGESGMLYGDVCENIEFQSIRNPYYDSEIKVNELSAIATSSPTTNDIEAITTTNNIYYDL